MIDMNFNFHLALAKCVTQVINDITGCITIYSNTFDAQKIPQNVFQRINLTFISMCKIGLETCPRFILIKQIYQVHLFL